MFEPQILEQKKANFCKFVEELKIKHEQFLNSNAEIGAKVNEILEMCKNNTMDQLKTRFKHKAMFIKYRHSEITPKLLKEILISNNFTQIEISQLFESESDLNKFILYLNFFLDCFYL